MSDALTYGLPAAVGSAALYGVAPLAQAVAARREQAGTGLGLGLLARLTRRPLWLLGLAIEAVAFVLEVYSLSVAPVAMVGPVMALDMIVFTLLAGRALREHVSRLGAAAICVMVLGVGLLAYAFEEHGDVGSLASTRVLLLFLSAGLVFSLLAAVGANRAAARRRVAAAALGFGVAAGTAYAIATLATRQFGLTLDERRSGDFLNGYLVELLRTPAPYLLIVFSVLAVSLEQRGLQGQAAVVAFPVTSGVSAFLPVVLGLTMFDEPAPDGWHFVAFVGALLLIAAGIAGLARDRAAAVSASEASAADWAEDPAKATEPAGDPTEPAGDLAEPAGDLAEPAEDLAAPAGDLIGKPAEARPAGVPLPGITSRAWSQPIPGRTAPGSPEQERTRREGSGNREGPANSVQRYPGQPGGG